MSWNACNRSKGPGAAGKVPTSTGTTFRYLKVHDFTELGQKADSEKNLKSFESRHRFGYSVDSGLALARDEYSHEYSPELQIMRSRLHSILSTSRFLESSVYFPPQLTTQFCSKVFINFLIDPHRSALLFFFRRSSYSCTVLVMLKSQVLRCVTSSWDNKQSSELHV